MPDLQPSRQASRMCHARVRTKSLTISNECSQKPIPLDTPTQIELAPGRHLQVTLFDANHCPGSVMFCRLPLFHLACRDIGSRVR